MDHGMDGQTERIELARAILASDEEWRDHAACTQYDPEWWFPLSENDPVLGMAKAVCATCPVQGQCADAGRGERTGVWAGELKEAATPKRKHVRTRDAAPVTREDIAARRYATNKARDERRAAAGEVVRRMYLAGHSLKTAATMAHVGSTMARSILVAAGIPIRRKGTNGCTNDVESLTSA